MQNECSCARKLQYLIPIKNESSMSELDDGELEIDERLSAVSLEIRAARAKKEWRV
jgi:hypothetical protein